MKRFISGFLVVILFASLSFGQEQQVRHRSGPRRQLATIVFAGLGGAILGLSTLSFYGRPQDQLSNIAIGFAVGIIAGTAYVTIRSATSRDYYDDNKQPQSSFNIPEQKFIYGPLVTKTSVDTTVYGGI